MSLLITHYQEIVGRISRTVKERKLSASSDVTLVAVSKTQSVNVIEELYQLGHRDFGENYVQELKEKALELSSRGCTDIRWHFIGHLQTNKVKTLIPFVHCIHTVDSEKIVLEIVKRWSQSGRKGPLPIFLEVNLDQEPTKSGLEPSQVQELARKIKQLETEGGCLDLLGLMCVPSPHLDPRPRFIQLRELEKQCRPFSRGMLSMGMSHDFEIAIEEGATHVRVGSAIFGERLQSTKSLVSGSERR